MVRPRPITTACCLFLFLCSKPELARLRLQAGCCMLKLAEEPCYADIIVKEQFQALALMLNVSGFLSLPFSFEWILQVTQSVSSRNVNMLSAYNFSYSTIKLAQRDTELKLPVFNLLSCSSSISSHLCYMAHIKTKVLIPWYMSVMAAHI